MSVVKRGSICMFVIVCVVYVVQKTNKLVQPIPTNSVPDTSSDAHDVHLFLYVITFLVLLFWCGVFKLPNTKSVRLRCFVCSILPPCLAAFIITQSSGEDLEDEILEHRLNKMGEAIDYLKQTNDTQTTYLSDINWKNNLMSESLSQAYKEKRKLEYERVSKGLAVSVPFINSENRPSDHWDILVSKGNLDNIGNTADDTNELGFPSGGESGSTLKMRSVVFQNPDVSENESGSEGYEDNHRTHSTNFNVMKNTTPYTFSDSKFNKRTPRYSFSDSKVPIGGRILSRGPVEMQLLDNPVRTTREIVSLNCINDEGRHNIQNVSRTQTRQKSKHTNHAESIAKAYIRKSVVENATQPNEQCKLNATMQSYKPWVQQDRISVKSAQDKPGSHSKQTEHRKPTHFEHSKLSLRSKNASRTSIASKLNSLAKSKIEPGASILIKGRSGVDTERKFSNKINELTSPDTSEEPNLKKIQSQCPSSSVRTSRMSVDTELWTPSNQTPAVLVKNKPASKLLAVTDNRVSTNKRKENIQTFTPQSYLSQRFGMHPAYSNLHAGDSCTMIAGSSIHRYP